MVERGSGGGVCVSLSVHGSSVRGTWRGGFLAEGYVEKALERGHIWGT